MTMCLLMFLKIFKFKHCIFTFLICEKLILTDGEKTITIKIYNGLTVIHKKYGIFQGFSQIPTPTSFFPVVGIEPTTFPPK